MRQIKTIESIQIEGQALVVKELRPIDIWTFGELFQKIAENISIKTMMENKPEFQKFLDEVSNVKMDSLLYLGFSEIEDIWLAFKTVNSPFLALLESLGILAAATDFLKKWWTQYQAQILTVMTPPQEETPEETSEPLP